MVKQRWSKERLSAHHPFDRLEVDVATLRSRAKDLNREIGASHLLGAQYEVGHTYFFDIVGFIAGWPKVRPKGHRPPRYLWADTSKPLPPAVDFWRYSLKPLLDEYLGGIEPDARDREVARLRNVFLHGK